MVSRKLIVAAALLLLVAAVAVAGASQVTTVTVPPGGIVDSPNANANPGIPNPPVGEAPALPAATANVLFYDDFSNGLDRWVSLSSAEGTWVAANNRLEQRGDANGEVTTSEQPAVLLAKDVKVDNATLEAAIYPLSGSPVGLVFRGSDQGYYRLSLYHGPATSGTLAVLEKITPTGAQDIATAALNSYAGFSLDKWLTAKVVLSGTQITVSVDGQEVLSATDGSFSSGWAGVWTKADRGAHFDNVRIQAR